MNDYATKRRRAHLPPFLFVLYSYGAVFGSVGRWLEWFDHYVKNREKSETN